MRSEGGMQAPFMWGTGLSGLEKCGIPARLLTVDDRPSAC
jgi:hypothetical protein